MSVAKLTSGTGTNKSSRFSGCGLTPLIPKESAYTKMVSNPLQRVGSRVSDWNPSAHLQTLFKLEDGRHICSHPPLLIAQGLVPFCSSGS